VKSSGICIGFFALEKIRKEFQNKGVMSSMEYKKAISESSAL